MSCADCPIGYFKPEITLTALLALQGGMSTLQGRLLALHAHKGFTSQTTLLLFALFALQVDIVVLSASSSAQAVRLGIISSAQDRTIALSAPGTHKYAKRLV
jgi:hypothetical protein